MGRIYAVVVLAVLVLGSVAWGQTYQDKYDAGAQKLKLNPADITGAINDFTKKSC